MAINFVPKMDSGTLMIGYKKIVNTIYSPGQYYDRIKTFLKEYKLKSSRRAQLKMQNIKALFRSIWVLGVREKGRQQFWDLVIWTLFRRPGVFPTSIAMAINGFHFRKVAERYA